MKEYMPSRRFLELTKALKICSKKTDIGKEPLFNSCERYLINQERAKLLNGNDEYHQSEFLEFKIQKTLLNNIHVNEPELITNKN